MKTRIMNGPREANFYGMRESTEVNSDGTWLEPEALAYPNGGFTRRAKVFLRQNECNPIELPYGELRIVRCSIPDTYFSIPARLRYRGRTVKGYISQIDDKLTFTPDADGIAEATDL
jgi:hypothetical protein